MKDINFALRKAFILAVEPALSGVKVYDQEAPPGAKKTYFLLKDINNGTIPNKCAFYNRTSLSLLIIDKFPNPDRGNYNLVDFLAGVTMERLLKDKALDIMPGFKVTGISKTADRPLTYKDNTDNVYTRALTFTIRIIQLNN